MADTASPVGVGALPMTLSWSPPPLDWRGDDGVVTISAGPRTDLFVDPSDGTATLSSPRLLGPLDGVPGDFVLSARVTVGFASTYDAGVLVLFADDRNWVKLCFEYSPAGEAMVVSVVNRGVSDDANGEVVGGNRVWLRIARIGPAFACHASADGGTWRLVRHFALPVAPASIGFSAQSPTGDGCTATFDHLRFEHRRLADLRDGS